MSWQTIGSCSSPMTRGRLLAHVSGSLSYRAWRSDLLPPGANATGDVIRLPPFANASQRSLRAFLRSPRHRILSGFCFLLTEEQQWNRHPEIFRKPPELLGWRSPIGKPFIEE